LQLALRICHGDWAVQHVTNSGAVNAHMSLSIHAIDDALRVDSIT
jgi:hypothetical protein